MPCLRKAYPPDCARSETGGLTMAEYKICFSVAGAFGVSFEAKPGVSYEDAAAALDKDK